MNICDIETLCFSLAPEIYISAVPVDWNTLGKKAALGRKIHYIGNYYEHDPMNMFSDGIRMYAIFKILKQYYCLRIA